MTELGSAAAVAAEALAPEDSDGAASLVSEGARALAAVESIAPELAAAAAELRDAEVRLRETASELRGFLGSLDAEPDRLEQVEGELERIADAKRRFRCASYDELVDQAGLARAELDDLAAGADPAAGAAEAVAAAQRRVADLAAELGAARRKATEPFAEAVAAELREIGLADGEFAARLEERTVGPTGGEEVSFFVRPSGGQALAPVATTASGGELSRIALAIAAVGGGETMIFDEIDAGIGGQTGHAVGETLRRLAGKAQVVTITHLPQIAGRAERHFRVEKVPGDPTHTRIEALDDGARREELERMVGGRELLSLLAEGPDG